MKARHQSAGTILWPPLSDNQSYLLTYSLQPPTVFQGTATVTGNAYFAGAATTISGDNTILVLPTGAPASLEITRISGFWAVLITGEIGRSYRIEAADDLASNRWQPLATLTITQNPRTFIDAESVTRPQRFYRCVLAQ